MRLRRATIDDAEMLLQWRNDPETRANSINQAMIAMDEHRAWLMKSFENPMRQLYVVEHNDGPIGTVRIDIKDGGAQELSWTVAPHARGQGLGKSMVRFTLQQLHGKIMAHIKSNNIPSIKIAESCGFKNIGVHDGLIQYEKNN